MFQLQGVFEPEPKRLRTLSQALLRRPEDFDDERPDTDVKREVPRLLSLAPEWLRPRPLRNENILLELVVVALLGLSSGKGVGERSASGSDRALGRSLTSCAKAIFWGILGGLFWTQLGRMLVEKGGVKGRRSYWRIN